MPRTTDCTLTASRLIADFALQECAPFSRQVYRPECHHMGALLADSVLQAGLNYAKVVRPRVENILATYPEACNTSDLVAVLDETGSTTFLQWSHHIKLARFERLLDFLVSSGVRDTIELSTALQDKRFRSDILKVNGVGPKTVDYMACLVGVDCIAVDRHIKSFAENAGLSNQSYDYLRETFEFAADLLDISRRQFDACVWQFQANVANQRRQFDLLN